MYFFFKPFFEILSCAFFVSVEFYRLRMFSRGLGDRNPGAQREIGSPEPQKSQKFQKIQYFSEVFPKFCFVFPKQKRSFSEAAQSQLFKTPKFIDKLLLVIELRLLEVGMPILDFFWDFPNRDWWHRTVRVQLTVGSHQAGTGPLESHGRSCRIATRTSFEVFFGVLESLEMPFASQGPKK